MVPVISEVDATTASEGPIYAHDTAVFKDWQHISSIEEIWYSISEDSPFVEENIP